MKETKIQYIGLDKIRPSKTNPRKHFDESYIAEQGDHAVIGNGEVKFYEIVAGECRFRGAEKAGIGEVPTIIRLLSDTETLEIQLIENLQRSDLTALEEAEAYLRLIDEMGYTVDLIHEKTGKARATIYGKLKMLRAPKILLAALEKGIIGERFCELVGRIPVPEMRERAAREILKPAFQEDPLNYRKASAHVSENYMRALSGAQFDQNDAGLVPPIEDEETGERIGGGACSDCPMKTGNRPELFGGPSGTGDPSRAGGIKRPDICANPKCFNRKTDAHFALLQKTAAAEGKKILRAEESAEIFEDDNHLWFDSPYVKLSEKPDPREVRSDFVGRMPHWKTLLENVEAKPQIVIAKAPRGNIVELVDRNLAIEAVNLAAKQKGERSLFDLSTSRAGSGSAGSSDTSATYQEGERKKREAAKLNFKITLAVMTELMGAIDKKGVVKGFWDALIEASITHAGHDGAWLICKRLGLDPRKASPRGVVEREGVEGAVLEYGLSLPDGSWPLPLYGTEVAATKLGFIVELLLSQRVKFSQNSGGLKQVAPLKSFLDLYKVDLAEIERRVKAEQRDVASGKKKKNLSGGVESRHAHNLSLVDGSGSSAPPAQHKFQQLADNKYRCKRCAAFAVKHEGKFVLAKEFRGKPCIGTEERSGGGRTSPRGKKCSHCSNKAALGKSMCGKCLAKNAARVKARRANRVKAAPRGEEVTK